MLPRLVRERVCVCVGWGWGWVDHFEHMTCYVSDRYSNRYTTDLSVAKFLCVLPTPSHVTSSTPFP